VVAGDLTVKPAYVERIRHQIIAHGFQDRVDLLGQVSDDRLQALYAHCDVLAVPSRYEGFGMVYLEAMAHGKPVIATTAGAAHEFVCDAKTGFLVPPGDARQLADRLDLMMRQPARRRRMGRRAYEVWRHHPTWSDTAEMIERFLQGIISRVA
jgi:glycosyltransferase involved in cell wall biosynthesis